MKLCPLFVFSLQQLDYTYGTKSQYSHLNINVTSTLLVHGGLMLYTSPYSCQNVISVDNKSIFIDHRFVHEIVEQATATFVF